MAKIIQLFPRAKINYKFIDFTFVAVDFSRKKNRVKNLKFSCFDRSVDPVWLYVNVHLAILAPSLNIFIRERIEKIGFANL